MNSFMKFLLILGFVTLATNRVNAQTGSKILGNVQSDHLAAIPSASVKLFHASDSTSGQTIITNEKGQFEFSGLDSGTYYVSVTAISFNPSISNRFTISIDTTIVLDTIRLNTSSVVLQNVTVEGYRQPVENKLDKIVVNINASPTNAGATALDILGRAPGVVVDNQGNVSLKGKAGVQILIDGKPTYLSPQDLAVLLKGMPAGQLSQIEIMSQPSALYDAAGNAGVINLKLGRNRQSGFNGSINLSYSQGRYGRSPNSIVVNYSKNKLSLYSSFSYSKWTDFNTVDITRKFTIIKDSFTVFRQNSFVKFRGDNYNLRTGMDYQLNSRTTLGLSLSSIINHNKSDVNSLTNIYDHLNKLDSVGKTTGYRDDRSKNFAVNVSFDKRIDSNGRRFTTDADYVVYKNTSNQKSYNYVTHPDGTPSSAPLFLRAYLPADISIYSLRSGYLHPIKNNTKFEAGIKTSFVQIDNKAPYEIYSDALKLWVTDTTRADHFRYYENINAVYFNFNKDFKRWSFQAGLRYEQTKSTGKQVLKDQSYPRTYAQLFPTFYAGYKVALNSQFIFSYGRRLERPNYQDMNPFQRFLDKFTYIRGNPFLQPQFTNNLELSYSYKSKLNTTFYCTFSNNIMNDILVQNDSTKITFRTKGNIGNSRILGLSSNYTTKLTSWWFLNVFANIYRNHYNSILNGIPLNNGAWNFNSSLSSQTKFATTWTAEITGSYQSQTLENAIYNIAPRGVLSFALAKQLLNNNATITLNVIDPCNFQMSHSRSLYGNINLDVLSHWDNRRVSLSFIYRFKKGKAEISAKSNKSVEEQKRVN